MKSLININFDPGLHSPGEALENKFLIDKYKHTILNRVFEKENLDNILKYFEQFGKIYKWNIDFTWWEMFTNEIGLIITENPNDYMIDIYTNDYELLHKVMHDIKPYLKLKDERGVIWKNYFMRGGNLMSKEQYLTLKDFNDINEKYYPYLDVDTMLNQFLHGNESILILASEKGTAKSKFVSLILKKILNGDIEYKGNANIYVGSTKDNQALANDEFWQEMRNYDFVVFDDAEFSLFSNREESREDVYKNQFLSNLLSFSDGVHKNNTKIIITTNQPYRDLDEALLRAGRLFAILAFRPLTWEEALEVWKSEGLDEKLFEKEFNEDYIYPADLGSKINNIKRNKKLIDKKEWIKDPEVDVLNKVGRKVGLI